MWEAFLFLWVQVLIRISTGEVCIPYHRQQPRLTDQISCFLHIPGLCTRCTPLGKAEPTCSLDQVKSMGLQNSMVRTHITHSLKGKNHVNIHRSHLHLSV